MLLSLPPPGLLFYHEIADEQRVDSGRIEAADGIARSTNQGIAEEVEAGVIKYGKPGGLSPRKQQGVIKRIIILENGVDANRIVAHDRALKCLAVFAPHPADGGEVAAIGSSFKIFVRDFGGHRGGELSERLAMLDKEV